MNVLFLNTLYYPTFEESLRLDNIQREVSGWRAELLRDCQIRGYNQAEISLSKQNFHNGIRKQWKVITCEQNEAEVKVCS